MSHGGWKGWIRTGGKRCVMYCMCVCVCDVHACVCACILFRSWLTCVSLVDASACLGVW